MPLVAIVGRPNVGKSTLFNRLTEERAAIVHDQPGVTRDRVYGDAEWNGRVFDVVDTGGYVSNSDDRFEAAIREQVQIALAEADAVLFVADVTTGITDLDEQMARVLRKTELPVFVVANKADNPTRRMDAAELYSLGLGEVYPVSAVSGSGTGDLLDDLVAALPEAPPEDDDDAPASRSSGGRTWGRARSRTGSSARSARSSPRSAGPRGTPWTRGSTTTAGPSCWSIPPGSAAARA